ncbi:MAG TPA: hypothetical protein VJ892_02655 [Candidatus Absconditabacterales bacterium]|nr:hypothetical protein [Candidatus Absconditabacterales bacterium]
MEQIKQTFNTEPSQSSGRELTGKFFIGLIIGGIISALLFMVLSFVGSIFTEGMSQTGEFIKSNPILPLLLLLIGFLSSFIGNLSTAGIYGLFFSQRYYNTSKTMGLLLLTNGILFLILAPVYLIFSSDLNTLFIVLGFHIMLSVFLSINQIEIVGNPNYAGSSLIGSTLGFAITILIYSLVRKGSSIGGTQEKLYLLLLLPSIIGFAIIPLGLGIREKIYYKMYEVGNNGFYTPSINNKPKKDEDLNSIEENDDINIDLS